jgi:hypothetical protein
MTNNLYECFTDEGSARIRSFCPQAATEEFAMLMARDGELFDGDDTLVDVTAPDGTVTKWRCTIRMEPEATSVLEEE